VHRIGRTGRAGSQGTAITFVTSSEFGKLGFIRRVVKMDIQKKEIPEIEHIIGVRKKRISDEISNIASGEPQQAFLSWADELMEKGAPREIIASVLSHSFSKMMDKSNYRQISKIKNRASLGRVQNEENGQTRLFIARGKKDGMSKRSLVEFIVKKAGVQSRIIDKVEVFDTFSFISTPFADAERILERFKKQNPGKKSIVMKAKK
jgi:ATP-dependent RNA helicase DeaD